VKFAFIHAEKAYYPVSALCRNLQVTRQGYYAFSKRPPSPRVAGERALCEKVLQAYEGSRKSYGSPRVWRALRRDGLRVGKRRVERAMRAMGLVARSGGRYVATTQADPSHTHAANTLDRRFSAARPNQRWVTDICVPQQAAREMRVGPS
jgi:transposase InsO family protein